MKWELLASLVFLMLLLNLVPGLISAREQDMKISPFSCELNDSYDFVIISPNLFCDKLEPLIAHKEKIGIQTLLVSLEDIYSESYFHIQGRDEPEQIKYFIKNAKEFWDIDYVMLVGNEGKMPVRYSYTHNKSGNVNLFITDLYYADLFNSDMSFCSWDSNNNDKFGETRFNPFVDRTEFIDEMNMYPDVHIGRLLCNNHSEVDIVVNKIINYENGHDELSWFQNLVLFGGNSHQILFELLLSTAFINNPDYILKPAAEGEYLCDKISALMNDFTFKKIYASNIFHHNDNAQYYYPSIEKINQAITSGAGFVLISAHGTNNYFVTYPPFFFGYPIPYPSGYTKSDVKNLSNGQKLPIVELNICKGADFSVISGDPSPLAWEFVKHENGGSIATFSYTSISATIIGSKKIDSKNGYLTYQLFKSYQGGERVAGRLLSTSITNYLQDDFALNEFHGSLFQHYSAMQRRILIGDPTLRIGGYEQ